MHGRPESEASHWLRYAREDMAAARALHAAKGIAPREVCLLCQQSAEKHLKALLIAQGKGVPRTHDLVALSTLAGGASGLVHVRSLEELTRWAVASRYPDDWADATHNDAAGALAAARTVGTFVSKQIRITESGTT